MAHLVTAQAGKNHITSANWAHENAGQIGNGQYAFKGRGNFALSMPNTNTLRIMSGDAQCNGYHWEIPGDYEEVTIENGTPGKKRIDLVVADIWTAPTQYCDLLVIKGEEVDENAGEPVMPSHIEGDLNDGDTHVQMPICSVKLNGTNHDEPVMLMNVLMPYAEFRDSQSQWVSVPKEDFFENVDIADAIKSCDVLTNGTYLQFRLLLSYTVPTPEGERWGIGRIASVYRPRLDALIGSEYINGVVRSNDGRLAVVAAQSLAANTAIVICGGYWL